MTTFSHNRPNRVFRFIPAMFLVLLAAILIAPNALACHRLDKDGNPRPHGKQDTCTPPNPTPPPEANDTSAYFYDNHGDDQGHDHGHVVESGPRDFVTQGLELDSGDYVAIDLIPGITINTTELTSSPIKGKSQGLCRELEDDVMLFPESYSYGWTDNCTDGDCAIEIRISFGGPGGESEQDILSMSGGRSDQVDFVMHSVIENSANANPFSVERHIPIHRTVADFKKPGTTRSVVICEYSTGGWGYPEFHSVPSP